MNTLHSIVDEWTQRTVAGPRQLTCRVPHHLPAGYPAKHPTHAFLTLTLTVLLLCVSTAHAVSVSIDKGTRYQTIEGMGAFMSIAPWKYRSGPFYMTVDLDQEAFYDSLISQFGPTMIRVFPDYNYEADSGVFVVTDGGEFAMRGQFENIRKLKAAANRQHEPLLFIMSVLSPPAYQKVSGQVAGGTEASPNYSTTDCRLKDGYDDVFARYVVRYLQVQKDSTGVDMYALNIQNEPAFQEPYASCVYNGFRFASVSAVVGAALGSAAIPTRLFGGEDMMWRFPTQFEQVVRNDASARGYFCAWAGHGYTDGVQADTGSYSGDTPTDKPLWMSETSGAGYGATTGGMNDWPGAMTLATSMHTFLREGRGAAWVFYTLMSNSSTGDYTNTYGLYTDGVPNAKGHVSAQFNRYIRPGARQVASTSDDGQVRVVAFYQEQHDCLSMVLLNSASSSRTVTAITGSGVPDNFEMITSTESAKWVKTAVARTDAITLPAQSIVTLVAGTYRGTEDVVVQPAARPAVRNAGCVLNVAVSHTYGLDGRRMAGGRSAPACGVVLLRHVDGSGRTAAVVR